MTTHISRCAVVAANVTLDIRTEDVVWGGWSSRALIETASRMKPAFNPIIYAEVSIDAERIEELDDALPQQHYERLPLTYEAGFLAAKAFLRYRRAGAGCRSPLPDFYVGVHAVSGLTLPTREAARYRTYLPTVELICP